MMTYETILAMGNVDEDVRNNQKKLDAFLQSIKKVNPPVEVDLGDGRKNYIYYKESSLLTTLRYYPFIQLGVIALFLFIGYSLFSTARKAEQNQVWVGMSKETAHQLGTPLSSLMAWNELRKITSSPPDFDEIEKDIKRLEVITERFSKIGSPPVLSSASLNDSLHDCITYMRTRISKQTSIDYNPSFRENIPLNISLFEWVIENLIRNSVDAMEGAGKIIITTEDSPKYAIIDILDTGKGISKSAFKTIFKPGFTTKKRGWGLGLSLAKRIIENYHNGKIFVKESELNKGTIFRIMLPKS
jgi:signal transduction histidine kinase